MQESPTTIVYTLLIHDENGAAIRHTAKGIFEGGKLIKTEPANPKIYDIMTAKKRTPVPIL